MKIIANFKLFGSAKEIAEEIKDILDALSSRAFNGEIKKIAHKADWVFSYVSVEIAPEWIWEYTLDHLEEALNEYTYQLTIEV